MRLEDMPEPTEKDLKDPEFNAIYDALEGWDIETEFSDGYSEPTGNHVMHILNAIRKVRTYEL